MKSVENSYKSQLKNKCLFEISDLLDASNLGVQGKEADGAGHGHFGISGKGSGSVAAEALGSALDASGGLLQRSAAAAKAKTANYVGILSANAGGAQDHLVLGQAVGLDAHLVLEADALTLTGGTDAPRHVGVQSAEAANAAAVKQKCVLVKVAHFQVVSSI